MKCRKVLCIFLMLLMVLCFPSISMAYTASPGGFTYDEIKIPAYSGEAYVTVNSGNPRFTKEEMSKGVYENYSPLDSLGRCGAAEACINKQLMPTENRNDDSTIHPTGWVQKSYSCVEGGYLYNRCHLLGYQLTAENGNKKNLITGTRYLNIEGMLPFENQVADYIEETGKSVMYRVTPVFRGDNLLPSGVLMEGESVSDNGKAIKFCVYCYNVQPGVSIDYATGKSRLVVKTYKTPKITSLSASSGGFKVTSRRVKNADGYQVAYKRESAETYRYKTSSGRTITLSGLTAGKTYDVKMRSYQNTSSGKKYSSFTKVRTVKAGKKSSATTYVLNTNSKKIHLKSCRYVSSISSSNYATSTKTIAQLKSLGYSTCKVCLK